MVPRDDYSGVPPWRSQCCGKRSAGPTTSLGRCAINDDAASAAAAANAACLLLLLLLLLFSCRSLGHEMESFHVPDEEFRKFVCRGQATLCFFFF